MTTAKMQGEHIGYHLERVLDYTTQALPYRCAKAMGAVRRDLDAAYGAFLSELRPYIQKHTGGEVVIRSSHPNYPAFRKEADEVFTAEVEVEVEAVPMSLIDEAAEIMEERAKRGLGDPLVIVYEDLEALKGVGIFVEEEPKKSTPKRPAKKRAKAKE